MVKKTRSIKRKKSAGSFFRLKKSYKNNNNMNSHENILKNITKDWVGIQNTAYWDIGKSYTYKSNEGTEFQSKFEVGCYITHYITPKTVFRLYGLVPIHQSKEDLELNAPRKYIRIFEKENIFYILFESSGDESIADITDPSTSNIYNIISEAKWYINDLIKKHNPVIVLCGHSYGCVCALKTACSVYMRKKYSNLYVVGSAPFRWMDDFDHDILVRNQKLVKNIRIYGLKFSSLQKGKCDEELSELCSGLDPVMKRPKQSVTGPKHFDPITKIFSVDRDWCNKSGAVVLSEKHKYSYVKYSANEESKKNSKIKNLGILGSMCLPFTHDWRVYRIFFANYLFSDVTNLNKSMSRINKNK